MNPVAKNVVFKKILGNLKIKLRFTPRATEPRPTMSYTSKRSILNI